MSGTRFILTLSTAAPKPQWASRLMGSLGFCHGSLSHGEQVQMQTTVFTQKFNIYNDPASVLVPGNIAVNQMRPLLSRVNLDKTVILPLSVSVKSAQ